MQFKTVYVDVIEMPKDPKTINDRTDRWMELDQLKHVLTHIRSVSDHISFALFSDVNEHPNVDQIFTLCYDLGFRFSVTVRSAHFVQWISAYTHSNAISSVHIPLCLLQEHGCFDTEEQRHNVYTAIHQLKDHNIGVMIDLFSKELNDYHPKTIQFLSMFGFEFDDSLWQKGFQINLDSQLFIRCCEQKEEVDELPAKTLGRCYGSVTMLGVMANGNVIPCNHINGKRIVLGNLLTQPIHEIISTEPYVSIHDGFYKNQLVHPVCQRCPHPRKVF